MKISNKISLLVLLALGMLALNSSMAFFQLNRVEAQFVSVVRRDLGLMEAVNKLYQQQLEQKVLFEKLKSVAEELGVGAVSDSRRGYLQDYLRGLRELCVLLKEHTALTMKQARSLLGVQSKALDIVERGYQEYQDLILSMIGDIEKGNFQLSFEHLENFSRKENKLTEELKSLLKSIEKKVAKSVIKARAEVESTAKWLWLVFIISVLFCGLWAWYIIASINQPLSDLIKATGQIGKGDFLVNLKINSKDEIAQVAESINSMSVQLEEFKQRLEEQNKTLMVANRELDRFVHTASHDIVGPLTAIVGYSAYLEQHYASLLDDKGKESLAGVRKGAGRLNKLVKDLLELTRVSRIKNPYTEVAVGDIIDEALAHCDFAIHQSHAKVNMPLYLPTVVGDRIKLTTIFTNLIGNAIKYSAKNNPQGGQIDIAYQPLPGMHEFTVKDNGIGIPPEHHKDIFDLFSRLHASEEEYQGQGAGLAIVKAAVEDQGGSIRVESTPHQGSSFIFTIPNNLTPYRSII